MFINMDIWGPVQDPKENANINTYIIKSSEKWHGRSSNDYSVGSRWEEIKKWYRESGLDGQKKEVSIFYKQRVVDDS